MKPNLARAREAGHYVFDQLWTERFMSRQMAYKWLAKETGMSLAQCHFKYFDEGMCEAAIWLCSNKLYQLRADRRSPTQGATK